MLKQVIYKVNGRNRMEIPVFCEMLRRSGAECSELRDPDSLFLRTEIDRSQTLILTDDRKLAAAAAEAGMVCVGLEDGTGGFFDGAGLVLGSPEEADYRYLDEFLRRECGEAVTIAVTPRLVIREMTEQDFPAVRALLTDPSMKNAVRDSERAEAFSQEHLGAYIRRQYRTFGFGLWSVLYAGDSALHAGDSGRRQKNSSMQNDITGQSGTLIGLCGFDASRESDGGLELEYLLAQEYRRKGLGTEMCRAALEYAYHRLEAENVRVRIRPENTASLGLAESLGFHRADFGSQYPETENVIWMILEDFTNVI